jgi:hypothetical protein
MVDEEQYHCFDCDVNTLSIGEYYMLEDYIWEIIIPRNLRAMLCISCVEARLERKLRARDFRSCPLNYLRMRDGSSLLINRLTTAY